MNGKTMVEKIMSRISGGSPVKAGDELKIRPDFVMAYDFPGYTDVIFKTVKEKFGLTELPAKERFVIFIDHMVPAVDPKEEEFHEMTRAWCREYDITCVEREGIGHHVAGETGYGVPGAFAVHYDGHISQLGALGCLAVNMPRQTLTEAFVREYIDFQVPQTIRLNLVGKVQPGVMPRDLFHGIVQKLGNKFARFAVLEIGGEVIDQLSLDGRQALTSISMFTGALSAVINPDQAMLDYALPIARVDIDPVTSDPDCEYLATHTVDVSEIGVMVAQPPSPSRTTPLNEVSGLDVQVGYLGSCASGRIEDLRAAAKVLKGKKLAPGFSLHVVPTSRRIMTQAAQEGLLEIFSDCGAFVSSASCDFCYGRIATMREGQRAVSTGTLNVKGRMGSPDSEIFLVNAAVVARTAIDGRIPRSEDMIAEVE
ncbi:aconitase family protein [Sulfitobacter pontiacus]|uniref:3-isopropylmalate dehydratase large subunit n=1 Tax=Sulfitobacter pontiacus TaxID=60137 RepID=UPI0004481589|nr:aconitase family protein [Sulfitobacter pontiacus]KAJ30976.1 3-isopropylmalate dehydratase [Sulfitobacter pontiacus 3SOLIMAR09]WPZ26337.1 aconitase family protein [Sulfitobacter pontiacus]